MRCSCLLQANYIRCCYLPDDGKEKKSGHRTGPSRERSAMNEEPRTMQTADITPARAPEDAPALVNKIGKTTYKVRVHFNDTSTETKSDKIKRMLKNEIQQM